LCTEMPCLNITAHLSKRFKNVVSLYILILTVYGLTYISLHMPDVPTGHVIRALGYKDRNHSSDRSCARSVHTERPEELDFPLAYSIMVFTDLDRAVRLLKAVYRSHNQYCIHVDRKTPKASESYLHQAAMLLGSNILFVPPEKRVNVKWGTLSVLQPELLCAQLLMQADAKWKYWINLTGHEFPLKTNWEIVSALRAMNGTNVVEAIYKKRKETRIQTLNTAFSSRPRATMTAISTPQFTWYKGPVHVIVRREFVDYMLNNPRAKQLYNTLARQAANKVPDETYFATLNHNPDTFPIPGAFLGVHETNWPQSIARFKIWNDREWARGSKQWIREICMLGWADLPKLQSSPQLFANKFVPSVEPDAYGMLELWLARKVHYETTYGRRHPSFNLSYYRNHEMSWNHL
ncbi:uncharacterized protein DEA37_0006854, partial [Paragonimus westermani]